MKNARNVSMICAAVAAVVLAGCGDDLTSADATLYDDAAVTLDIAASAGDAAATIVDEMKNNEDGTASGALSDVGFSGSALFDANPARGGSVVRARTCYDAAGAVVAGCTPFASVRKIVAHTTIDGSRTGGNSTTGGTSSSWSGAVHRILDDTTVRAFTTAQPPVETSRTHNNFGVGHDTTTFTNGTLTRLTAEVAHDSVKGVTWNVPRSSNPFPVSGMIVRVDSVHLAISKENRSITKDIVRTVEVDFPADAQGNVVLKVNAKTCNLNLFTHVVSGCH